MDINPADIKITEINNLFRELNYKQLKIVIVKQTGYINASKICRMYNKSVSSWKRKKSTIKLLNKQGWHHLITLENKGTKKQFAGTYVSEKILNNLLKWINVSIYNIFNNVLKLYHKIIKEESVLSYVQYETCFGCYLPLLHPKDVNLRKQHLDLCEKNKKVTPLYKQSCDKKCGICMEIIYEKDALYQFFGLLGNCNHIFCFECIDRWMETVKGTSNKDTCPECRTPSKRLAPSRYWINNITEKKLFLETYFTFTPVLKTLTGIIKNL